MFKIKCEKNKAQTVVTIRQQDSVDLSSVVAFTVNVYTDDLIVADATYGLTAGQLNDILTTGIVEIESSDLFADMLDDFYTLELVSENLNSNKAGLAITLEAQSEVFSNQGSISVYSPDYRLDNVLITAFMLLTEMNTIENMDVSLQKRVDFTTRQALLKDILNY